MQRIMQAIAATLSKYYRTKIAGGRGGYSVQRETGQPSATHCSLSHIAGPNWYSSWTPPTGCAPWHPNQINPWCYDANGNVLSEGTVARSFTYDAENRQVTECINTCAQGSPTATYLYDGLGQRVGKTVNGQTTTYVYDAFGNLAAEYGGGPTSACGTPTRYVTTDHLGSTRLLTNNMGSVGARCDYEPFGQEIGAGYDGRLTAMGFPSGGVSASSSAILSPAMPATCWRKP